MREEKITNFILCVYVIGFLVLGFLSFTNKEASKQITEAWKTTMIAHRVGGNAVAAEMLCE